MNICVTLNPCLDKTLIVPAWKPGMHQIRGTAIEQVVGGKGVNVARALSRLGHTARPALFLGGEIGRLCERLLSEQDRLDPLVAWTAAPTREILTVRTKDTADQTAFFDPNPVISPAESDDLAGQLAETLGDGATWCVMSGSSPCATTDQLYAKLITSARKAGVRTLVDTYGKCLEPALRAAPDIVKINRRECEQALGTPVDSASAIQDALKWMRRFGVNYAAITFGERGMAAAWNDSVQAWKPPKTNVENPIGAGDAMAAGLIDGLMRGDAPSHAFRWAMACAVSSVERWTACDIRRPDVERMATRIRPCTLDELF